MPISRPLCSIEVICTKIVQLAKSAITPAELRGFAVGIAPLVERFQKDMPADLVAEFEHVKNTPDRPQAARLVLDQEAQAAAGTPARPAS